MATATYPPPPPCYKMYKDYAKDPYTAPAAPPPIEGPYVLYDTNYTTDDVLPDLEEQGARHLYPKGPNIGIFNAHVSCLLCTYSMSVDFNPESNFAISLKFPFSVFRICIFFPSVCVFAFRWDGRVLTLSFSIYNVTLIVTCDWKKCN